MSILLTNSNNLLNNLLGTWRFDRDVPGHAQMKGEAVFHATPQEEFLYREEGLLISNHYSSQFFKEYIFQRQENGFSVYFSETPKRLFHKVLLQPGIDNTWHGTAAHQCLCDHYETNYIFFAADKFLVTHKVKGPRKNYEIKTIYESQKR